MDEVDSGVETPAYRRDPRRPVRGGDPLEDRLDRWVSRGRQFVDGVAGARPGTRQTGRGNERRPGARPTLDSLGRWVENRIDWLLEDGDDWREPWEEQEPTAREVEPVRPRRRLEAVSRRGRPPQDPAGPPAAPPSRSANSPAPAVGDSDPDPWPDDAAFTLPRWQRGEGPARGVASGADVPPSTPSPGSGGRPLPRSSRRRG